MKAHTILIIALAALLLAASGMYVAERKAHDACKDEQAKFKATLETETKAMQDSLKWERAIIQAYMDQGDTARARGDRRVNDSRSDQWYREQAAKVATASDSANKATALWKNEH